MGGCRWGMLSSCRAPVNPCQCGPWVYTQPCCVAAPSVCIGFCRTPAPEVDAHVWSTWGMPNGPILMAAPSIGVVQAAAAGTCCEMRQGYVSRAEDPASSTVLAVRPSLEPEIHKA